MFILIINNTGDLKYGVQKCAYPCVHMPFTQLGTTAWAVPTEGLTVENRKIGGGQEAKIRVQEVWK